MADGVLKALKDLEDVRDIPDAPKETTRVRQEKVLDLKMRGISNTAIARALGVDPSTIWRDLKKAREEYREGLENEPAANLIAESLMFLDRVEEVCLFEANQTAASSVKVDPDSGEVIRDGAASKTRDKIQFIRAALTARDMKTKLMLDTGVIPKEPEKLYHSIKPEQEVEEVTDFREEAEIRQQVIELLKRGRNL